MSDKVIAYDWQENPIYESDGENYFKTEFGYIFDDFMAEDIREFMIQNFGNSQPIHEWLKEEIIN